jgi:hypothetical protein
MNNGKACASSEPVAQLSEAAAQVPDAWIDAVNSAWLVLTAMAGHNRGAKMALDELDPVRKEMQIAHSRPTAAPELPEVKFVDAWDCAHTLSLEAAGKELKVFYDAWPGGLEEIESAIKTAELNHSVAATSTLSSNPNGLSEAGWKLMPPKLSPEMKEILKEAAPRWNSESIYASLLSYAAPLVAAEVPQIQKKHSVAAGVSLHGEANGLSGAAQERWTLTAPDGKQWQGESAFRAVSAMQTEKLGPVKIMENIRAAVAEMDAEKPDPVAWRVKDFGDGWVYVSTEQRAKALSEEWSDALIQPLYTEPPEPDYEAMEREHFGDIEKGTGIYHPDHNAPADSKNKNHVAASSSLSGEPNGLSGADCTEPNRSVCPRLCQDFCNKAETEKAEQSTRAAIINECLAICASEMQVWESAGMLHADGTLGQERCAHRYVGVMNCHGRISALLAADSASPSAAPRSETLAATEGVSAKEQVLAVHSDAKAHKSTVTGAWKIFGANNGFSGEWVSEDAAWEAAALKVNESAAQGRKEQ